MEKVRLKRGDLLIFARMGGAIAVLTERRDKFAHFATKTRKINKKTTQRWWGMTFTHGNCDHPRIYYTEYDPNYNERHLIRQIQNGEIEWHPRKSENENES